jgi:hypothetical protein
MFHATAIVRLPDGNVTLVQSRVGGSNYMTQEGNNRIVLKFVGVIYSKGAAVVQAVQCLTTSCTIGVRSPAGAKDFSSSPCVQTGSGAHPASYPMGAERGKARPGRDADHSPPI